MLYRIKTIAVWRYNRRNLERYLILSLHPRKVRIRVSSLLHVQIQGSPVLEEHRLVFVHGQLKVIK
jgi:hypothetical protein